MDVGVGMCPFLATVYYDRKKKIGKGGGIYKLMRTRGKRGEESGQRKGREGNTS